LFTTFQEFFAGFVHKMVKDTAIQNPAKNADRLLESEKIVVTCKRINVSPHELSGAEKSSRSGAKLEHQNRFLRNISLAQIWLKDTHSTLSLVNDFILQARKIAIQMLEKTFNHEARKQAVKEVRKLFVKIVKILKIDSTPKDAFPFPPKADPPLADTVNPSGQDAGEYIFACDKTMTPPFAEQECEVVYQEDTEKIELGIEPGFNMRINLVDSNFLTKPQKTLAEDFDLDPGIDQNTQLSLLNRGKGVNLGSIRVIDNNVGMFWDINLHHAVTVGDVINTINSSGIAGLNIEINASKKSLKLTYTRLNESKSGQELTISERGETTAKDLGILGNLSGGKANQTGSMEGRDLNPILTQHTPISLLKSGQGLSLGTIKITLGRRQKTVDLSSVSTVGEIIDAINNSIEGVVASINNPKKGISIESTVVGQSLMVSDSDDKKSASNLGISGSPDIWGSFLFLLEALNNEDVVAISKSLETLDLSLEEISNHRTETEAKLKRLENIEARIIGFQSDTVRVLSEIRRIDLLQATTDLAHQKSVYQSALQSGDAMIQPTLFNFIR
jgi:flagellin-like hook-associated protein FlgL